MMKGFIVKSACMLLLLASAGCSSQKKLAVIREAEMAPELSRGREEDILPVLADPKVARDTIKVRGDDGRELFIMKAVRDENGEMVATDVIDAAVVSACFSNVAERGGEVNLAFRVRVPAAMRDSRWQLRFNPELRLQGDTLGLDPVIITGGAYRKAQLRGYQHYERFVSKIVQDTATFIRTRELELFLKRNIPAFYAFRSDSSFVSEETVRSAFGVSGEEAMDHYTRHLAMRLNERRKGMRDKMFRRYVKSPILRDGVRLDTVMVSEGGDFIYDYVQTVATRPGLRKAEIVLQGEILEQDRRIYSIPEGEPMVFYISSLATLADHSERYLLKIVERKAEVHTACYVGFESGKWTVDPHIGNNALEIGRIKGNIRELLDYSEYVLDSVVVSASASPEGSVEANRRLSQMRSMAISEYFGEFIDSLRRDRGMLAGLDGGMVRDSLDIRFISRSGGENWVMLDRLVSADTVLTDADRARYERSGKIGDPDRRERALAREKFYRHLRASLYPRLRTVRFDFHLHRRDMVKDTIHTTVPDTLYRRGVEALSAMDYTGALAILGPYRDFNTALAYAGLGRNANALAVLEGEANTPEGNYLKALLYCREGKVAEALESYRRACSADPSYVHRGNLDPEIASLIRLYGLNPD